MDRETSLDGLRKRVGVETALTGIVSQPEIAKRLQPAVERALTTLGEAYGVREAAGLTAYGPLEFSREFNRAAGMTFGEFVDRARVDAAILRIATTDDSAESVAQAYGFMGIPTLDLSIGEYTGLPLAAVLSLLRP